jgi:Sensors of blue-light using FAD
MHYIIYVSQAKKPMDAAALEALLLLSRQWNTSQGLSGMLIYRYSSEAGDDSDVRTLYEKIRRDKRHHTILTLGEGEIEARMFSDWAMGFKNVDDALLAGLPGHARIGEASFDPAAFQHSNVEALKLLKFFHDAS